MVGGSWRMAVGGDWQLAVGKWRLVAIGGGWRGLVFDNWWLVAVGSRLALGAWSPVLFGTGRWRLVVGGG